MPPRPQSTLTKQPGHDIFLGKRYFKLTKLKIMKKIFISMLLVLGISFCVFGLLSGTINIVTKSSCEQQTVKLDISFDNTHSDNLLKLKFSIPHKSVLYTPVDTIDFEIRDKISDEKLLSLTIPYKITKAWFGSQEYFKGEFYIDKSFLINDKYDFLLVLYDNQFICTRVDIRSFYCEK